MAEDGRPQVEKNTDTPDGQEETIGIIANAKTDMYQEEEEMRRKNAWVSCWED